MEQRPFGERLRELRQAKGLSQRDAAALAGCHYTYISMLESQGRTPSGKMAKLLLDAMEGAEPRGKLRSRDKRTAAPGLGERVRSCRRAAGLTQRDLADRAGVSIMTASMLETSGRKPYTSTLRAVAAVLGVTPEYLLTGTGEPKPAAAPIPAASNDVQLRTFKVCGSREWRPAMLLFAFRWAYGDYVESGYVRLRDNGWVDISPDERLRAMWAAEAASDANAAAKGEYYDPGTSAWLDRTIYRSYQPGVVRRIDWLKEEEEEPAEYDDPFGDEE